MNTLKDVAKLAGVSTSTVSRVLNRPEMVAPEVRKRVGAALKQLNYQPNLVAKALKTKTTGNVGVVLNDMLHFDLASLTDALSRQNLNLILYDSEDNWGVEGTYIRELLRRRVDAFIIAPVGVSTPELAQLAADQVPTLLLCEEIDGLNFPTVSYDVTRGSYRSVTYLLDRDHRRVGFIAATTNTRIRRELFQGFGAALSDRGVPLNPSFVRTNTPSPSGGQKAMAQILTLGDRPTAVFVAHARMAQGVMKVIHAAGLRCPEDISVIVFGDSEWARASIPPLTVLEPEADKLGEQAVSNLISLLNDALPAHLWHSQVPTGFIERHSVQRLQP
jgi:DNA-binding LacI/PurR family transcriptional regulator